MPETQRIKVEKVLAWERSAYETLSKRGEWGALLSLTVIIEDMDILAASLAEQLAKASEGKSNQIPLSVVPNIGQIYLDSARWSARVAIYQQRLGDARAALELGEEVCFEVGNGDELCLPVGDFVAQFLAKPILFGDADAGVPFPDAIEGLRITNALNAAGTTFDAAATLERYAGLHVESWMALKQTGFGQTVAGLIDDGLDLAKQGATKTKDWIEAAAGSILPVLVVGGLIAFIVLRARK